MSPAVDPDVLARTLYGGAVSGADLAKSIDAADVHIDGPVKRRRKVVRVYTDVEKNAPAAATGDPKKDKRLAALGLGATGVAGVAGVHALKATGVENAARVAHVGSGAWKAPKVLAGMKPTTAAKIVGAGALGLHGVELVADSLAARAQLKALKKPKKPEVTEQSKGLRVRVKPIGATRTVPSLRARKPAGSPAVDQAPHWLHKSVLAEGEISKVDEDKRQVFGWANVSKIDGQEVLDRQGDLIDIEELEKAAYDYVLDSRIGGDQHQRVDEHGQIIKFAGAPLHASDVIESMVFTPEKIEKMGLPATFTQGWWIGMQVNDEPTWQLIKSGKRTGFSVHGTGRRESIEKFQESPRKQARVAVRERASQAAHPPAVKRKPTPDSSMAESVGYQRQTRKLDVEMRNRPGAPYSYRVKPKTAAVVLAAPSLGRAYNEQVKNKAKHHDRYTLGDRARLFVSPA